MAEIGRNLKVNLLPYSEVLDISGRPGNFYVKIAKKPRYVTTECTSCNDCVDVCPVIVPNEFEEGMAVRHAIYVPFPQAVPATYIIDRDLCFKSDTLACDKCFQACTRQAINFDQQPELIDLHVGAIIMATGYELYDAKKLENYGYGLYDNVISMMELERLTSASGPTGGNVTMTGYNVKKIALLLCAGSRDKNHIPYCSRICCMYAMKQAYVLKKMLGIDVHIYYTDIRATGKGYEELYWRNQEAGVIFTRGKVADIWRNSNNKLNVLVEDTLTGNISEEEFDLVALATPMIPSSGLTDLANKIKLSLGEDGFIQERHPKLDPVDSLITGIYACGCALSPKDVRDTVSDALGAAAKASLFLKSDYITTSPEKAYILTKLCDGCGVCIQTCPSNAITMQEGKAAINPFMCTGCGACVPICPKESIDFKNSTTKQIFAQLHGVLLGKEDDEVRIIAFVDQNVAYTGIDFLGLARVDYPENIRIVSIPSTAIIGLKHLLYAFAFGADGILLIEGQQDIDEEFTKKRILEMSHSLEEFGIKRMRLRYSYVPLPVYKKAAELFTRFTERIKKFGPLLKEKRMVIKQKVLS
jgi:heterodisulfide reductase subunit A